MSLIRSLLGRTSLFHGMLQAQGTRRVETRSETVETQRTGQRPDEELTALEREDVVLINKIRRSLYADA